MHSASNQAVVWASIEAAATALEAPAVAAVSGAEPSPLPDVSDEAAAFDVAAEVGAAAEELPEVSLFELHAESSSAPVTSSAAGVRRFMYVLFVAGEVVALRAAWRHRGVPFDDPRQSPTALGPGKREQALHLPPVC